MYAIVAVSESWGIGKDNDLLFHIRADLKRFKEITSGHTMIMGRKTLQSLPGGKGLPNRRNLVLTTNKDFSAERAETVPSAAAAVFAGGADAFVVGGETVYRQFLSLCERVYVTRVFADPEADAFFPNLEEDPNWEAAWESDVMEENGLRFQYVDYVPRQQPEEEFPLPEISAPSEFAMTDGFHPFTGF